MRIAVLRPEPGNAATMARLTARGLAANSLPLFAVTPVAWQAPAAGDFDALLITSANAVRHAGDALVALAGLPVVAVGDATARAARAAGLTVALVGTDDAAQAAAAAQAAGFDRLLHLAGEDHVAGLAVAATVIVYASRPTAPTADAIAALAGTLVLLHSVRAARCFAAIVMAAGLDRATIGVAAISPAVAAAAGDGWRETMWAARPSDAALVDLATRAATAAAPAYASPRQEEET